MNSYLCETVAVRAYSKPYVKTRIQEHFGENVILTKRHGKADIVTLRRTAASILEEFHVQQKEYTDPEHKKLDVIKLIETCCEIFPLIETDINKHVEFLPLTLKLLLEEIVSRDGRNKKAATQLASIRQAMIQSTRPRAVFAPLQIGLAVQGLS